MGSMIARTFPLVNAYRAELRAASFERLSPAEAARMEERFAVSHRSNAMADVHPSPEMKALLDLFVRERVPLSLAREYILRFIREEDTPERQDGPTPDAPGSGVS